MVSPTTLRNPRNEKSAVPNSLPAPRDIASRSRGFKNIAPPRRRSTAPVPELPPKNIACCREVDKLYSQQITEDKKTTAFALTNPVYCKSFDPDAVSITEMQTLRLYDLVNHHFTYCSDYISGLLSETCSNLSLPLPVMNNPAFLVAMGVIPSRRKSTKSKRRGPRMVARAENDPNIRISAAVERLYDAYPFPPETLLDEAPLGYNWRWHFPTVYAFCAGIAPKNSAARILDAGCGTGESTSYLAHLNPKSRIVAIDLSNEALSVAKERLQRSVAEAVPRVEFVHKSIFDLADIPGEFDYINCVGVIHHTPDPTRALRALAEKLAPGGLCHIFVYAKHGRWEISLMQRAIRLLRGNDHTKFEDGVRLGRSIFAALPEGNRLKTRERERWEQENKKDATFADMYLHPQEVDYDIESLFNLIDQSGLDFLGFSNPSAFNLERLFCGNQELLDLARRLPIREQYQLIELLDAESVTHFEFFLAKPPFQRTNWSSDEELAAATGQLSTCVTGWPSNVLLDRDYAPVTLKKKESAFLKHVVDNGNIGAAVRHSGLSMDGVRTLIEKSLLFILQPASK